MNNNGFGGDPIRKYKGKGPSGNLFRTIAVLVMTAVIIAFVVIFIMSLTGTGMFADKKEDVPPQSSSEETSSSESTDSQPPESSEDPNLIKYQFVDKNPQDLGVGLLQLINKEYLYDFYQSEIGIHENLYKASSYFEVNNSGFVLKYTAFNALDLMAKAFYESCEGKYKLLIMEAYRDFDTQKGYNDSNPTGAVPPGASDYHSGATVQIKLWDTAERKVVDPSNVSEARWLKLNAHKYGFIFRAPAEKKPIVGYSINWQLRYVGAPHAEYMYDNSLCLEEYLTKLRTTYGYSENHLTVNSSDGNTYEVYYVAGGTEGTLRLPVPENRPYSWSGDNVGGYIVTVTAEKGEPPVTSSSNPGSTSDPETTT